MVIYDIAALLSRFDMRVETETALTGKLSSLLGESLLLNRADRFEPWPEYCGRLIRRRITNVHSRPRRSVRPVQSRIALPLSPRMSMLVQDCC
jgi:hypothetical protein